MTVAMLVEPPNCTGNHIGQLNPDAHVGRRQEDALNEVSICRGVAASLAHKSVMLQPKAVVLMSVAVVANDDAICFMAACCSDALEEVLKPLRDHLIGSEVDVFLLAYVAQAIGKWGITNAADQSNRFCAGDYGKNSRSKIILPILIPISHGIVSIIVGRSEEAPLHLAAIAFLALQANKLVTNPMPAFFWYNDPAKDEKSRTVTTRFSGRPAFINETKVHSL